MSKKQQGEEGANLPIHFDIEKNRLKRLQKWMKENEVIASKLAYDLGESRASISQLLNGVRPIKEKKAREIENALKMGRLYLDRGEETVAISVYDFTNLGYIDPNKEQSFEYLVLPRAWLDSWIVYYSEDDLRFIYNNGDSMSPTINSGDYAIVDSTCNQILGTGVYCLAVDNDIFIKRVYVEIGNIFLISDNPIYPSGLSLDKKNYKVLGKVVAVQSPIKWIDRK